MALALDGAVVAFEVDRFDEDGQSGWSVLVTGTATRVTDVSTLVRLEQLRLSTAAGEDRSCWMRIVPAMVTGRRVPTLGEVAAVTDRPGAGAARRLRSPALSRSLRCAAVPPT
jgi:hypothetical protein